MKKAGLSLLLLIGLTAHAHHYKGLPHYGYFENYPQIPTLEFIKETPKYEMFVTIFNFQGFAMEQVESPDDVRFYVFLYDVERDKVFNGIARFEILSHGQVIHDLGEIKTEQESIFVIQKKIEEQDDLVLQAKFTNSEGEPATISVPISLKKSWLERFGIFVAIGAFFGVVALIKTILTRLQMRGVQDVNA